MTKPKIDVAEVFKTYSREMMRRFKAAEGILGNALDRGAGREEAIRQFLRERLPSRYGVAEGFVVDHAGDLSRQTDIIIYDASKMPRFSVEEALRLWPTEAVYGVVEVKSRLSEDALNDALDKIGEFKRLSRSVFNALDGRVLNPPLGFVVAYDLDTTWTPDHKAFYEKVANLIAERGKVSVACVPELIFVVSGCGMTRGQKVPPNAMRLSWNGTFFNFFDYGEASLAMFLLVLQTFLDDCELGPTKIINYADFVHKPDGPKPVG